MHEVSDNPSIEADVIVVGAGFAGITAARELKAGGLTVALLEARSRLGGRSLSRPIGEGKVVELGCEFHGQPDSLSAQTARSVGIGSQKVYDTGYKLIDNGGTLARWKGSIPKMSPAALVDFGQAALRLERMRREVPQEEPWQAPHAGSWDNETMWSWTQRNVHTSEGRSLMRLLIESGMAASPAEVSLLHVLNYSNGTGGFRATTTVTGGTLENRFQGGSQNVALRLAESVADETYVGAEVRRIVHSGDSVRVSGPGFEAVGRRVVIAIPVPLTGRIEYDPVLPGYRDQLSQRMTMGAAIKYLALYDEAFWRADGMTGLAISHTSPIRAVLDSSPTDGTPGVLTAFVTGPPAREVARLSRPQRRELLLRQLTHYFGPKAGKPYDVIEQNWMAEPYTRGCYHGYAPPGLYTQFGRGLKEPIGRIHWAGAETVPVEFGSMSGAIHSGRRVAAEILGYDEGMAPSSAGTGALRTPAEVSAGSPDRPTAPYLHVHLDLGEAMFLSAHIAQTSQPTALAAFRRCPDPESIQGMRYSNTWLTTSLRSGVLPSLRVTGVMLIAAWDDEQSLDRFVTHPRAKPYADGWRVRLEPARSIGSLPGLPDLPRQEKPTGDRPVAAFTAGRMRANRVLPFIKAAGAAEREASTHPGFLGGITLMRPPMGIGTFTLWRNVREMRQYSLGTHPGGHSKAIGKDRAHPFHHDMLFSRFIPYAAEGEWNGRNPLDMLDSLPRA